MGNATVKAHEEWKCPKCFNKVVVFIALLEPPTCTNHFLGKGVQMVQKKKKGSVDTQAEGVI